MTKWIPGALAGLMLTTALGGCAKQGGDNQGADQMAGAQKAACDRDCLLKLTDAYVAGLAKHSVDGVPIEQAVAVVENAKRIKVGEGLWKETTAGPDKFQLHVPDPVNQTAGWLGVLQHNGKPAVVAIRLKLGNDGKIVEAEHLYADIDPKSPRSQAQLANLQNPRPGLVAEVPAANRLDHDTLIRIGASYYDALDDNDGSKMPFAPDCERHENGMITASSNPMPPGPNGPTAHPVAHDCKGQLDSKVMTYITSIGNRRVFAADPVTGLVMGLSHFHHPMDFKPYEVTAADGTKIMYSTDNQMKFKPFDLPAAHIFKVGADGKVHEIEAMGFMAPFNSPSGWETRPAAK